MGPTKLVGDYVDTNYPGKLKNPGVGYDEPQKIAQRINDALTANPAEPINLIGHSYGASTAAQLASTINAPINQLILIDPVGRGSVGDFRSNVQTLITVTANPSSPNVSDTIASIGGKGAGLPVDKAGSSYSVDTNHADFGTMMAAPGPNGLSAQKELSQYGATFGFAPAGNQSLTGFNPPPPAKR